MPHGASDRGEGFARAQSQNPYSVTRSRTRAAQPRNPVVGLDFFLLLNEFRTPTPIRFARRYGIQTRHVHIATGAMPEQFSQMKPFRPPIRRTLDGKWT
jgi:hypothetical protein